MRADIYVQGDFWASITIPGDSLIALLAKGMITEANEKVEHLATELADLDQVQVSVNMHLRHPVTYKSTPGD